MNMLVVRSAGCRPDLLCVQLFGELRQHDVLMCQSAKAGIQRHVFCFFFTCCSVVLHAVIALCIWQNLWL